MAIHVLRLGLILSVSLPWFFANTGQSSACSCVPPDSPSQELARSATVFSGKVIDVRKYDDPNTTTISSTDPTTIEFEVTSVWKGPSFETIYLTTPRSEASCGFTFVKDEEYVVYSRDGTTVSLCSRTALLENADADPDELGQGHDPQLGTSGTPPEELVPTEGGGCGFGSATDDAAWLGIMAGLVWFGVRRRSR